ncbi:ribbon-helix-helix protein, CopG family [Luteibacter yeojuensis]
MPTENRTARLTILIDPRKKAVLERLCAAEDTTPSQVVRRLIREYIERASGRPWHAEDEALSDEASDQEGNRHVRGR